ncbi:MAG: phosphoglucosamine mutase [Thermodesulfobacteriota bacterium]|nr:phosphoglucosamine mutase [Thermodesulfobacteriota bacterium]
MGKLFGTDGIRGVANEYPITCEMAMDIGRAVAYLFRSGTDRSKIVIGKDTRISGDMIEYALVSGICSMGLDALLTGVLPTPGIAYMTSSLGATAGIVISASHNPFYDNGIKLFNKEGFKLSDAKEEEIEHMLLNKHSDLIHKTIRDTGRALEVEDAGEKYSGFLKSALPEDFILEGMKIVIDCANGATYQVAPKLFKELDAEVYSIFISPNGKNINENCGSQHTEKLCEIVLKTEADIGLAFDGDGDRLIAVDEKGDVTSGDQILAVCANTMKQRDKLKNNLAISTVMSNLGLKVALKNMNIDHMMTDVGDRYVMEQMISSGAVLGGEDSGHMIFLDQQTTGDGILTALKLIESMKFESKPLSELKKVMTVFPQSLINVEVKSKPEMKTLHDLQEAIESVEKNLGEQGRVLVRYSGTQPVCRVMVEGPTEEETRRYCKQLADIVKNKIG